MATQPTPPKQERWPDCDRCSASSLYWVITGTGPIYLCGHHYSKYKPVFERMKYNVIPRHA